MNCRLALPWFLPFVIGGALLGGGCVAPAAVAGAGYAADGSLLVVSDKTAVDHLASMVSKQDCALWRVIRGRPVCKEREDGKDPYNVDYDHAERMVGEDGVHYVPPLRAAADAPASSWNASAYKAAPAAAAPAPPVAGGAPAPAPSAAPPLKAKKSKAAKPAQSVKKPSRGPAAPAS